MIFARSSSSMVVTFIGQMADKMSSDSAQAKAVEEYEARRFACNRLSRRRFRKYLPAFVALWIPRDGRGDYQTDGSVSTDSVSALWSTPGHPVFRPQRAFRSIRSVYVHPAMPPTTVVSTA